METSFRCRKAKKSVVSQQKKENVAFREIKKAFFKCKNA